MIALITVNTAFAAGLAVMLIYKISDNYIWLAFLASWFVAEAWLSRDNSIKWWHWAGLFLILGIFELMILVSFRF